MKLDLSPDERRALRARAHHLDPVVLIGNGGLTPAVLHEIDVNLSAHGLIKIRVFSDDREARDTILSEVADSLDAAAVQHIGKLLVVYRPLPEPERKAKATKARPAKAEVTRHQKPPPGRAPRGVPRAPGVARRLRGQSQSTSGRTDSATGRTGSASGIPSRRRPRTQP